MNWRKVQASSVEILWKFVLTYWDVPSYSPFLTLTVELRWPSLVLPVIHVLPPVQSM